MELRLSRDAINKAIMAFEVGWSPKWGFELYNRKYRKPVVPDPVNTVSGVTIGIGYDCGQCSANKIKMDWQSILPLHMVTALMKVSGLTKQKAVNSLPLVKDVDVPIEAALQVFYNTTIVEYAKQAARVYPDFFKLHPVEQSVITGLIYNRGAGMEGDRRIEMKKLIKAIKNDSDKEMATIIRDMCRLWPKSLGLRRRREAEAALIELADLPVSEKDILQLIFKT